MGWRRDRRCHHPPTHPPYGACIIHKSTVRTPIPLIRVLPIRRNWRGVCISPGLVGLFPSGLHVLRGHAGILFVLHWGVPQRIPILIIHRGPAVAHVRDLHGPVPVHRLCRHRRLTRFGLPRRGRGRFRIGPQALPIIPIRIGRFNRPGGMAIAARCSHGCGLGCGMPLARIARRAHLTFWHDGCGRCGFTGHRGCGRGLELRFEWHATPLCDHTQPKTIPTEKHLHTTGITRLPSRARSAGRVRACTGHRGLFTDAVMSVKSPQPYCRLGLGAPKTCFFTDAAWF